MRRQPFDRDRNEWPLLRVVVHSESCSDEILSGDASMAAFLQLGAFPFIDVLFTPSRDSAVSNVLQREKANVVSYRREDCYVSMDSQNRTEFILLDYTSDFTRETTTGSTVTVADDSAGRTAYCFVVGSQDPYYVQHCAAPFRADGPRVVSVQDAYDLVRILLVNSEILYLKPNWTIDACGYYLYRFKKVFHEFQFPWSVAVSGTRYGKVSAEVHDHLASLGTRLQLVCMAADQTSFHALKSPDNLTLDRTLYHFAYLVMLCTGVFDDLAWLMAHRYGIVLDRRHIKLTVSEGKTTNDLYRELGKSNKGLCELLRSDTTQRALQFVLSLAGYRSAPGVHHRHHVKHWK